MITSFILIMIILIVITVVGVFMMNNRNTIIDVSGFIMTFVGVVSAIIFFCLAGLFGGFGFNIYKEVSTTDFSKALATDHSSVTIVWKDKPYMFNQFNVVHNFDTITNVLICERKSIFGCPMEWNMKIVTPSYKEPQQAEASK